LHLFENIASVSDVERLVACPSPVISRAQSAGDSTDMESSDH